MLHTTDNSSNYPTGFFHFGKILIPADTGTPDKKCLISHFKGHGEFTALCFRTNWIGVWFGLTIDDHPFSVINNGHCLHNMGLIGNNAHGMPCYLTYFNSNEDLAIACNLRIKFSNSVKIWMGNNHSDQKYCECLHVYLTASDINPSNENMLTCSTPSINNVSYKSDDNIVAKIYATSTSR